MNKRRLIVVLKGGLGNQMFQYATGRALSIRNNVEFVLDTTSGFLRDKVYRRSFSLDVFPIRAARANLWEQIPSWFKRGLRKFVPGRLEPITRLPWGVFLDETELRFLNEIFNYRVDRNTWMDGYWASEKYFRDYRDVIGNELAAPEPVEPHFLSMAKLIESCDSVAVGVRRYEEAPVFNLPAHKSKWLIPYSFYENAANVMAENIDNPIFFVFCTTLEGVKELKLPGQIYYVTGENGFGAAVQTLWLLSKANRHIISNSSFYWWGAWLAEHRDPSARIIAGDLFVNQDPVPERWTRLAVAN